MNKLLPEIWPKGFPLAAERFLHFFLRKEFAEEVEGDLEEKFYKAVHTKSHYRAELNHWH